MPRGRKSKKPIAEGLPSPEQIAKEDMAAKKAAVLHHYATTGRMDLATERAQVGYTEPYGWAKADPQFAKDLEEARLIASQLIEDVAWKLSTEGEERTIYYRGEVCGYEKEIHGATLLFMLKNLRPDRYRDHSRVEVGGDKDKPVVIEHKGLSDETIAEIRRKLLGLEPDGEGEDK